MQRIPKLTILAALFLIVSLLSIGADAQSRKDKDQAKKFQESADKAVSAKNYREAADLYGRSVQLVPNNSYAHYRKGFAHFSLKEYDQAVNALTTALNQGFKPLDIYRIRYFVYLEQGNYDAALVDVEKGLGLVPNDLSFLSALGEINLVKKDYPKALDAFERSSKASPNSGDIYYNIARVAHGMGDAERQLKASETAMEKGTRFPAETFFLIGDANQKLRNNQAAIAAYNRVLGIKTDMYQIYQRLSDLYKAESRYDDAIAILKKGLIQYVNDGNFFTELGLLYSLAGRHKDAVEAARSGVQLQPTNAAGYTNLCRAYNETKEFRNAVDACNTSLRIRPEDGETYFYLGNALALLDRTAEATRAYSSAVRGLVAATTKSPEQSDLWYLLGNSYFADKQYDKAIDAYLKCLNLSPKFFNARVNLGIAYTRKKDKPSATEQYNLLMAVEPSLAAKVKAEIDKM